MEMSNAGKVTASELLKIVKLGTLWRLIHSITKDVRRPEKISTSNQIRLSSLKNASYMAQNIPLPSILGERVVASKKREPCAYE